MIFEDRTDAGEQLAERLAAEELEDPVVLALPRGGVPVAAPVAAALGTRVVPFVARKIGAPGHEEFGIAAIAEGSDDVVCSAAVTQFGVTPSDLERTAEKERSELERRVRIYRQGRPLPPLEGRDVVVVDDGLATGITAEAALASVRRQRPRRLVLAVPVASPDTARRLAPMADDLVCLFAPDGFRAVGQWYVRFGQTTDEEVVDIVGSAPADSE